MKKLNLIFAVSLLSASLLLFSCGSTAAAPQTVEGDSTTAFIVLFSNQTTGYSWTCNVHDTSIVELVSNEYVAATTENSALGTGGAHYFVLKGKKEGSTQAVFTYARTNGAPSQKKVYEINVNKDLSTGLELVSAE